MKTIFSALLILLLSSMAYAKPLKIEMLDGSLVRCGDWKNTEKAVIIRDCPEIAALFSNGPDPTPQPEPTQTPQPTPTPVPTGQPVICEARFVDNGGELILRKTYPPGVLTHTCAYIPPVTKPFIEVSSVNGSNASCNVFLMQIRSPSGVEYESRSVQPGAAIFPEVGTWQIDITLEDDEQSLCARNKDLTIHIPTY